MGRFESNALAPRYRHHPPRDARDLDGSLSGALAAFKFAISAHFKKSTADSFRKDFAPRPILLFQKMRGWLRVLSRIMATMWMHQNMKTNRGNAKNTIFSINGFEQKNISIVDQQRRACNLAWTMAKRKIVTAEKSVAIVG